MKTIGDSPRSNGKARWHIEKFQPTLIGAMGRKKWHQHLTSVLIYALLFFKNNLCQIWKKEALRTLSASKGKNIP
jgi:hypothetical protein